MAIPSIFVGTLAPLVTQALSSGDEESRRKVFRFSIAGISFLAGASASMGVLFAGLAIKVVAGPSFEAASTVSFRGQPITSVVVLQILCVYLFLAFIGSFFSSVLLAAKLQRGLIWSGVAGLVCTVVGNFLLIPRYSYFASASLTVLTELVMIAVMTGFLVRTGWLAGLLPIMLRSAAVSLVTVVIFWKLEGILPLYVSLIAAPTLYFSGMLALGKEERGFLRAYAQRIFKTQPVA
jgi:O-antigen/teichoic acid export membrane protein